MESTASKVDREKLARETAEHVVTDLIPLGSALGGVLGREGMPTTVADVAAALLDGHLWISWMDDRVEAAMRQLHGEPTGYVADLLPREAV
jgi:hypothetical protein